MKISMKLALAFLACVSALSLENTNAASLSPDSNFRPPAFAEPFLPGRSLLCLMGAIFFSAGLTL